MPNAIFHTDAVQGFLKVPFQARTLGADLITISGHKVHATKGVGALYIRKGLTLPPYLYGGGQESGMRSGTEAMPLICGFGAACQAGSETMADDIRHMERLRDLARHLLQEVPGLVLLGAQDAPHIVNFSIPGLRSQGILNCLQSEGVYVSAGSACARGHRSHVLQAMQAPPQAIGRLDSRQLLPREHRGNGPPAPHRAAKRRQNAQRIGKTAANFVAFSARPALTGHPLGIYNYLKFL